MTKKQAEQALRKLYDSYIYLYSQRDPAMFELLDEDLSIIGGATHYVLTNRDKTVSEYGRDYSQLPVKMSITTTYYSAQFFGDIGIVSALNHWAIPNGADLYEADSRIVMVGRLQPGPPKIVHCSVSVPMQSIARDEHFPLKEMEERNAALEKQIARKTKQLQAKQKAEKKLIEEKAALEIRTVQSEKELLKVELSRVQLDLQYKEQELAMYALNLASKRECLSTLEENINSIKQLGSQQVQKELQRMISTMQANLSIENEWEKFQARFNAINSEFIHRLKSVCDGLSATEINVLSMMRLNMSPKDIANFKYVSLSNVQDHIARIRKKLGIKREESLSKFLMEL